MPTREELHQLVDSLPDEALTAAHAGLTHMQTWPPPELVELEQMTGSFEERLQERMERFRHDHPDVGGVGGGRFTVGPGHERRGRQSFAFEEGHESVQASTITHDEYEFTLIERIARDPATRTVTFVLELTGPDGTTARHEHPYPAR